MAALRPAATASWRRRLSRLVSRDWSRPHWRVIYYHAVLSEQRSRFLDQLDALSEHFTWCSVSEGVDGLVLNTLDRPRLSLTFDDADQTVYKVVLPELARYGVRACIYVVPQYVEQGRSYRDPHPRPIMTWRQLREWIAAGHEVGSHTHTHANARSARWLPAARSRMEQGHHRRQAGGRGAALCLSWGNTAGPQQRLRSLGCYESVATTHRA
ncbi:MAG: polysaccharide deacetylase family protein [Planctomycetaceae bacterium]